MRTKSILACVAICPTLLGASEPETRHLQPSSQWVLDYADDSCRLIRTFGEGSDQIKLVVDGIAPGHLSMVASGNPVGATPETKVRARFEPTEASEFQGTAERVENGPPAVLWSIIPLLAFNPFAPPAVFAAGQKPTPPPPHTRPFIDLASRSVLEANRIAWLDRVRDLMVLRPGKQPVALDTGSLAQAMKLFDKCEDDLVRDLGLDPSVQRKIVRPAWADKLSLTDAVYPPTAISRGIETTVTTRLIVDAAGKVTKCTTLSQFDAPEFNSAVCAALSKARVKPAELADGSKVSSYLVETITFRLA